MTSQLNVDTIADKAGTGPVGLNKQHAAKVWFQFNCTGTPANRGSFNASTLTDNGTGDFSHNFTNAMNNDDFSFTTGTNGSNSSSGVNSYNTYYDPTSTGTGFVRSQNISSGGTGLDNAYVMGMVGGDLA